jgi:hypothetical protein
LDGESDSNRKPIFKFLRPIGPNTTEKQHRRNRLAAIMPRIGVDKQEQIKTGKKVSG